MAEHVTNINRYIGFTVPYACQVKREIIWNHMTHWLYELKLNSEGVFWTMTHKRSSCQCLLWTYSKLMWLHSDFNGYRPTLLVSFSVSRGHVELRGLFAYNQLTYIVQKGKGKGKTENDELKWTKNVYGWWARESKYILYAGFSIIYLILSNKFTVIHNQ